MTGSSQPQKRHQDAGTGQSLVEFATSLFVLMVFILIVFDFGRGIYAYTVLSAAAQSGARYAITNPSDTVGIQNTVTSNAIGLDPAQLTTTVSQPDSNTVVVTVTYDFTVITPILAQIIGNNGTLNLQTSAAMRLY